MRNLLSLVLLLLLATSGLSQNAITKPGHDGADDAEIKRLSLLSDLQSLASDSLNLDKPLARSLAQAEIADVAWTLDRAWAKKLLREAYELTLPSEEEQLKHRNRPAGAPPIFAPNENRARGGVRRRVLWVASRDKAFAEELADMGAKKLGKFEEQLRYSELADQAVRDGDFKVASDYILRALKTDASQTSALNAINELAKKNRAAADQLIIQYIALLRGFPISYDDQSDLRTGFMLNGLVFPHRFPHFNVPQEVPPPGPAVVRAYLNYTLDRLGRMDQDRLRKARLTLLNAWGPLKQYAPELTDAFLELEVRSRRPNETVPLPKTNMEDEYKKRAQEQARIREELEKDQPDEREISAAISRGDFAQARKLIDKLKDGPEKNQLAETVNVQEALGLAAKGDTPGAERLAGRLNKAASVLRVYPVVIEKCVANKDHACALGLVARAVGQLKQADTAPATPPAGIPASAIASSKEFDPVVMSLGKLAKLILPLDEALALEVLGEMIAAANRSEIDTGQGRTGFESDIFRAFAAKNEAQTLLAARTLEDRLRRIVSLAAVYKRRAEELKQVPEGLTQKGRVNR